MATRDAVAQRIAQAKLYKKGSAAEAQQGPSLLDRINGKADASAAGPSGNHPASGQDPVIKLTAYGQQLAEQVGCTTAQTHNGHLDCFCHAFGCEAAMWSSATQV